MAIGQPTLATATPDITTAVTDTGTKAAPGFDLVVFVFGTSAGILLARRYKK
jgi:nicotinamide riboside transporter PnuC